MDEDRMMEEYRAPRSYWKFDVFLNAWNIDFSPSGVELDIDQDGRSFAVFDSDADGDADVILMAPRSSPQLRQFLDARRTAEFFSRFHA